MKYTILIFILLIAVLVMPELVSAQPPGFPDAPDQAPIAGGLALLAAGGAAYAVNKLRKRK
jgi:hypothetical protein